MSNKTGRNQPCPCGSGRKYKHCCGKHKARKKTRERQRAVKGWTGNLRAIPIRHEMQSTKSDFSTPEDIFEKLRVPVAEIGKEQEQ